MQRLDKLLSEAGIASRRELKAILRAGRVTVNGAVVTRGEEKFDENTARITLDGVPVELRRTVLLMLHKPAGFVTSTDEPGSRTVMELLPERWRRLGALPVGRLDKDTEGLLLLTNDGPLAHRLLSPRWHVDKTYFVRVDGQLEADDVEAFRDPGGTGHRHRHPAGGEVPPGQADARQPGQAGSLPEAADHGTLDAGPGPDARPVETPDGRRAGSIAGERRTPVTAAFFDKSGGL